MYDTHEEESSKQTTILQEIIGAAGRPADEEQDGHHRWYGSRTEWVDVSIAQEDDKTLVNVHVEDQPDAGFTHTYTINDGEHPAESNDTNSKADLHTPEALAKRIGSLIKSVENQAASQ